MHIQYFQARQIQGNPPASPKHLNVIPPLSTFCSNDFTKFQSLSLTEKKKSEAPSPKYLNCF